MGSQIADQTLEKRSQFHHAAQLTGLQSLSAESEAELQGKQKTLSLVTGIIRRITFESICGK